MFTPPGLQLAPVQHLELPGTGARLAYRRYEAPAPRVGLVYCEGLRSDMQGQKSTCMEVESRMRLGCSCTRFDFSGQGLSSGEPDAASLQQWVADTLAVLDHVCGREPQLLVANSIGAWVALHATLQRPGRVKALVLIAPAVDITELWLRRLSPEERQAVAQTRRVPLIGGYTHEGDSLPLAFFESARAGLLLPAGRGGIPITQPVRIFHGLRDSVVPASACRELMEALAGEDVHTTLIKDGDHRLARPQDISAVFAAIQEMVDY